MINVLDMLWAYTSTPLLLLAAAVASHPVKAVLLLALGLNLAAIVIRVRRYMNRTRERKVSPNH